MPIIPVVGHKSPKYRLLVAWMYLVLAIGAVTVVYPFLLMLATSVTSGTDASEYRLAPRFFRSDDVLFAKYTDDKYAGDIDAINDEYGTEFKKVTKAKIAPPVDEPTRRLVAEWRESVAAMPADWKSCGFKPKEANPSELHLSYRRFLRKRFADRIDDLNKLYGEENTRFEQVTPPLERPTGRTWYPERTQKMRDYQEYLRSAPPYYLRVTSIDSLYARYLRDFESAPWAEARGAYLGSSPPADPVSRERWERFVRTKLPFRFLSLTPAGQAEYRSFLAAKYKTLGALNHAHEANYRAFDEAPCAGRMDPDSVASRDYGDFIAKKAPLSAMAIRTPETAFQARLMAKWGSMERIRAEYGLSAKTINEVRPPRYADESMVVRENAGDLRHRYFTRNYAIVTDYVMLHGDALWVTVLFCGAAIITSLTVNPLCAYAMSRFNLSYSYNLLLFVLATMAFPAEVVMIPNFLLLKELGLLNTFWALVLPGMANGFSIFLLKGFFDSLPNELYESGTIDGASEMRMFWSVTIPMSKPIFAVIALGAFTGAYGAFMYALLVCQNPRMWTLMVWLYNMQANSSVSVMMAALTLAALPTLLVFTFAQKVIIRGIIIPMDK